LAFIAEIINTATTSTMEDKDFYALHYETIASLCASASVLAYKSKPSKGFTGVKRIRRNRVTVNQIFQELGSENVWRSFRMKEQSFWHLLDLITPALAHLKVSNTPWHNGQFSCQKLCSVPPNGFIDNSVQLATALRYFAGGDAYDLAVLFKISRI
jgi:hypothetical protein